MWVRDCEDKGNGIKLYYFRNEETGQVKKELPSQWIYEDQIFRYHLLPGNYIHEQVNVPQT